MTYLDEIARLIRSCLPESAAPPDGAEGLFLYYAVLARAKGTATTAKDVHDAWVAWMSVIRPEHDALVPFDELKPDVQAEDAPYVEAVHRAAEILAAER